MHRWWIGLAALAGCYNPQFAAGSRCDDVCPGDLQCIEHVCLKPGQMPPEPDAPTVTIDAMIDAIPIDGPPGDVDADGITDNVDNCPSKPNADQHDEDGDMIGDVCDPCPHISGDKTDTDGDGVGDACDPQPTIAKQKIKFFDPFTSVRPEWSSSTGVTVTADQMRIVGTVSTSGYTRLNVATGELRIEFGGTIATVDAAHSPHQMSMAFGFTQAGAYYYGEFYDTGGATGDVAITQYDGANYNGLASTTYTGILPTGAFHMRMDESVAAQTLALATTVGGVDKGTLTAPAGTPALGTSTSMTVHIQNSEFRFNYWIVIETTP